MQDSGLKAGFAGAGRGLALAFGFEAAGVHIATISDHGSPALDQFTATYPDARLVNAYEELLASDINIVAIATPPQLHVPMTVAALAAGKHVICEVPAATDLKQCWELVQAVRRSPNLKFMLAENRCFTRANLLVEELSRRGLFGELYFGEGEYTHEMKSAQVDASWRRFWLLERAGVTYQTHSIGPALRWFSAASPAPVTMTAVSCLGSGNHYRDSRAETYRNQDVNQMLARLSNGGMARIRCDLLSNRPKRNDYYTLQGAGGCYEAPRGFGDEHKIWLADRHPRDQWHALWEFAADYEPPLYKYLENACLEPGFDSGTYIQVRAFVDSILQAGHSPLDVYTALDMTVPGLVSEASINRDGALLPVPDFRHIERFLEDLPAELRGSEIIEVRERP